MSDDQFKERVRALRARGHSPKEIARALGVRPAEVAELVRVIAAERAGGASTSARCWVNGGWSEGLLVDAHP
jgi:transcriptional regulator